MAKNKNKPILWIIGIVAIIYLFGSGIFQTNIFEPEGVVPVAQEAEIGRELQRYIVEDDKSLLDKLFDVIGIFGTIGPEDNPALDAEYVCSTTPDDWGPVKSNTAGEVCHTGQGDPVEVFQIYNRVTGEYITGIEEEDGGILKGQTLCIGGRAPETYYDWASYYCEEIQHPDCYDSDGVDASVKGFVKYEGIEYWDECLGESVLESKCTNGELDFEEIYCSTIGKDTCEDGRCIFSTPPETCSDPYGSLGVIRHEEENGECIEYECLSTGWKSLGVVHDSHCGITPEEEDVEVIIKSARIEQCVGEEECIFEAGDPINVSFQIRNVGDTVVSGWIVEAGVYPDDWLVAQGYSSSTFQSIFSTTPLSKSCQDEPFVGSAVISNLDPGVKARVTVIMNVPKSGDKTADGTPVFAFDSDYPYDSTSYQIRYGVYNQCWTEETKESFKGDESVLAGPSGFGTNLNIKRLSMSISWDDVYDINEDNVGDYACINNDECIDSTCVYVIGETDDISQTQSFFSRESLSDFGTHILEFEIADIKKAITFVKKFVGTIPVAEDVVDMLEDGSAKVEYLIPLVEEVQANGVCVNDWEEHKEKFDEKKNILEEKLKEINETLDGALDTCVLTVPEKNLENFKLMTSSDRVKFVEKYKCTTTDDCCDRYAGVTCIPHTQANVNKFVLDWDWDSDNEGFCFEEKEDPLEAIMDWFKENQTLAIIMGAVALLFLFLSTMPSKRGGNIR